VVGSVRMRLAILTVEMRPNRIAESLQLGLALHRGDGIVPPMMPRSSTAPDTEA
jgi:hypothetical protein